MRPAVAALTTALRTMPAVDASGGAQRSASTASRPPRRCGLCRRLARPEELSGLLPQPVAHGGILCVAARRSHLAHVIVHAGRLVGEEALDDGQCGVRGRREREPHADER